MKWTSSTVFRLFKAGLCTPSIPVPTTRQSRVCKRRVGTALWRTPCAGLRLYASFALCRHAPYCLTPPRSGDFQSQARGLARGLLGEAPRPEEIEDALAVVCQGIVPLRLEALGKVIRQFKIDMHHDSSGVDDPEMTLPASRASIKPPGSVIFPVRLWNYRRLKAQAHTVVEHPSRRHTRPRGSVRCAAQSHGASVGGHRARPPCMLVPRGRRYSGPGSETGAYQGGYSRHRSAQHRR